PKSEFWYFAAADAGAVIFAGLRSGVKPAQFEQGINDGRVAELVPRLPVKSGDSFFVPGGRLHAIGGGNLLVEIQENSDTTYRVFDWGRTDDEGQERTLHRAEAMRAIDFEDYEPQLVREEGDQLLQSPHFVVERWRLGGARVASGPATFGIFRCLEGGGWFGGGGGGPGEGGERVRAQGMDPVDFPTVPFRRETVEKSAHCAVGRGEEDLNQG